MNLNAYRIMWLFVFFDLPVKTKRERKAHVRFVINLKKDGFTMMQYSVYIRHCPSRENAEVHRKRVQSFLPAKGSVIILRVTDKQFGLMESYISKKKNPLPEVSYQLEFF